MKRLTRLTLSALLTSLILLSSNHPVAAMEKEKKQAIVYATFGTTVERALNGILNVKARIQSQFPKTEVRIAFTSSIIRKIWHKRQYDKQYTRQHPAIPKGILFIKSPLATIADLQDEGFSTIFVQPGHIALGEEYLDLVSYVDGLNSIKTIKSRKQPFDQLIVGRPAMGAMGDVHPYVEDIKLVAESLAQDAKRARRNKSALVYMGHGNDYFPSGGAYVQFAEIMNKLYPDVKTYIGTVEGFPGLDDVIKKLKRDTIKKITLKPYMTVAGDHAMNDMASDEEDSWKTILTKAGFETVTVTQGLGEIDSFADVFVSHILDTSENHNIQFK